ncbi:minor capsid protein [Candidatus Saccharibacteria bacterium]|nr:minor capsid protein [Candidatus Saccharibacteria bacterium]
MSMKRTRAYWQKRSAQRLVRSEKLSLKNRRKINHLYNQSKVKLGNELKRIYAAYYKQNGWDTTLLDSLAPNGDIIKIRQEMKRLGLTTELPANYKGRITRLDLLNYQIEVASQELALEEAKIGQQSLLETYNQNYYRTGYDISKGLGGRPIQFTKLDTTTLDKAFSTKWLGSNYAARLYNNSRTRAHKIQQILVTGIATGESIDRMSMEVHEAMDTSKYTADRLIRTETNYFHGQSELETYKQMGIEKYQLLAVLDNRTSAICQYMDGKVFDVDKAVVGENYHPFHPNCRTTAVPYFGKEFEPKERIARDPKTGENKFISNMSFDSWREKLKLDYADSDYDIAMALRKGYKTEYEEYKKVIGDKQMISYETFVTIRKNGIDATRKQKEWWNAAKAYRRLDESGIKPNSLDFYTFRRNISEPPYNSNWAPVEFAVDSRYHREYKGRLSLLDSHWIEHGEETGALSQSVYQQKAKKLLSRRFSDSAEWLVEKKHGNLMVYDKKTGEFAIARKNGIISSYYKAPIDYWNNMKEENHE